MKKLFIFSLLALSSSVAMQAMEEQNIPRTPERPARSQADQNRRDSQVAEEIEDVNLRRRGLTLELHAAPDIDNPAERRAHLAGIAADAQGVHNDAMRNQVVAGIALVRKAAGVKRKAAADLAREVEASEVRASVRRQLFPLNNGGNGNNNATGNNSDTDIEDLD